MGRGSALATRKLEDKCCCYAPGRQEKLGFSCRNLWWNLVYEPAWGCSLSRFWIYFCEDWGRHLAILGQSEGQEGCKRKLPWKVRAWCPPTYNHSSREVEARGP